MKDSAALLEALDKVALYSTVAIPEIERAGADLNSLEELYAELEDSFNDVLDLFEDYLAPYYA